MTRSLFTPRPSAPVVAKDAPEGRPSEKTTRIGHALRLIKIDNEFLAGKRDSIANGLDRAVASTGRKGKDIETLYAFKQAAVLYYQLTGKTWGEPSG